VRRLYKVFGVKGLMKVPVKYLHMLLLSSGLDTSQDVLVDESFICNKDAMLSCDNRKTLYNTDVVNFDKVHISFVYSTTNLILT
jgi:hypothetical protein